MGKETTGEPMKPRWILAPALWRRLLPALATLLAPLALPAQSRAGHEFYMDIPIYADSIQRQLTYPLAWRHHRAVGPDSWRHTARAKVWELMGPLPPRSADWDMRVEARERRAGYDALRISVQLTRWYRVKGYLLVPHGRAPHPAVNLLHDHGAHLYIGKEKMVRPFAEDTAVVADADRWVAQLYERQYMGDYLASHGFVVLSMDAPLWGDRGRKEGVDRKKYDIIAGNMMMMGRNLCAQMHWDDVLGTEFLASLPAVDPARIGAAGCSMGAYRAWMLAALSDLVHATAAVCWMTTTDAQLTTRFGRRENGGFANCIPGLRNFLDYPDIASIAAPRPLLLISGTRDKLFPLPGVESAIAAMRGVWADAGAAEVLETHLIDQPHECNRHDQQLVLDFLLRTLGRP